MEILWRNKNGLPVYWENTATKFYPENTDKSMIGHECWNCGARNHYKYLVNVPTDIYYDCFECGKGTGIKKAFHMLRDENLEVLASEGLIIELKKQHETEKRKAEIAARKFR